MGGETRLHSTHIPTWYAYVFIVYIRLYVLCTGDSYVTTLLTSIFIHLLLLLRVDYRVRDGGCSKELGWNHEHKHER